MNYDFLIVYSAYLKLTKRQKTFVLIKKFCIRKLSTFSNAFLKIGQLKQPITKKQPCLNNSVALYNNLHLTEKNATIKYILANSKKSN